jgi:predicted AAA+ superfamily ATPase
MDNGLLNLFLFNGDTKLLENIVALKLRETYRESDEPKVFYYKQNNVDLDFYVPQYNMAIQASYSLQEPDTRTREVKTLIEMNKVFKLDKALIVTYDEEETIEKDGLTIEVIPAWRWLLM